MINPLHLYREYRICKKQLESNAPYDIRFFNFWKQDNPDMWLYRFIKSRGLLDQMPGKKICFFSTFGSRSILQKAKGDVNVFFSGENLKRGMHTKYSDHFLNESDINFALGFECFEDEKYLRFPLWLMYMFEPDYDENAIRQRCAQLNHPQGGEHPLFACHVSSEDILGIRTKMCQAISTIQSVDCAGKVLHNCDDLWKKYADDKKQFISNYKFNICPENSNCTGYVTEKLFQAIDAGCIPVYWGSFNNPEPEVLNPDAIIFWEKDGNNERAIELLSKLNNSRSLYEDFTHQPRLKDSASEFVIREFHDLESRIRNLL